MEPKELSDEEDYDLSLEDELRFARKLKQQAIVRYTREIAEIDRLLERLAREDDAE